MTTNDSIGSKLTQTCKNVLPFSLSEAAMDKYPYAVYEYEPVAHYTKDGLFKWSADVTVEVVTNDFDTDILKYNQVKGLIEGINGTEGFTVCLRAESKECSEGIWVFTMNFNINQYV